MTVYHSREFGDDRSPPNADLPCSNDIPQRHLPYNEGRTEHVLEGVETPLHRPSPDPRAFSPNFDTTAQPLHKSHDTSSVAQSGTQADMSSNIEVGMPDVTGATSEAPIHVHNDSNQKLAKNLRQRYRKLIRLRKKNLDQRVQVQFEYEKLGTWISDLEKMLQAVLLEVKSSIPELDRHPSLKDIYEQAQSRSLDFYQRSTAATRLVEELSESEDQLGMQDADYVVAAGVVLDSLSQSRKPKKRTTHSSVSSMEDFPPENRNAIETVELPRLLEQYYDRKGDVGVLEERLVNLEWAHVEAMMARDLWTDQGNTHEISDHDFARDFEISRSDIQNELQQAITDARNLQLACQEQGIDTKVRHKTRSESSSGLADDALDDRLVEDDIRESGHESQVQFLDTLRDSANAGRSSYDREVAQSEQLQSTVERWREHIDPVPDPDTKRVALPQRSHSF